MFESGFKNFGTGAESESEKVTPNISATQLLSETRLILLYFASPLGCNL